MYIFNQVEAVELALPCTRRFEFSVYRVIQASVECGINMTKISWYTIIDAIN